MTIEAINTVCHVDAYSRLAFLDIFNDIVLSCHIVDLNRRLQQRDREMKGCLSGYYRWKYTGDTFLLWQRTALHSPICFEERILEVRFGDFVAADRRQANEVKN